MSEQSGPPCRITPPPHSLRIAGPGKKKAGKSIPYRPLGSVPWSFPLGAAIALPATVAKGRHAVVVSGIGQVAETARAARRDLPFFLDHQSRLTAFHRALELPEVVSSTAVTAHTRHRAFAIPRL
jgi:hypothetical protein